MVLYPANGVAKGEGGCLLLQHDRSSAVEEHDWEALVHSCENGGEHRPIAECHNWCLFGVTTSFIICLEINHQSQLLQWRKMGSALSRGTPHRKHWLLKSHAGPLSVHVVARFPRYGHCACSPCHWYGMWLHRRRWVFLRNLGWIWLPCGSASCDPGCTHWRNVINTWETGTVAAADRVRFARVRWEIDFLLTFETAPFFCEHPVYIYILYIHTQKCNEH